MKPRVTQGDIARAAGVHNTTVSLSLRNCPSIPAGTRQRIQAIAQQLGYYPDPALRALVAYRNGRLAPPHRATLALLTGGETRGAWREHAGLARAFDGAQRRAAELGYQLEQFWLGEPGMTPRRLSEVLFHRGIPGALLAADARDGERWHDFDWSRLSAIALGATPLVPALHRVTDDHGGMIRLALRRLHARGDLRVGLVTDAAAGEDAEHGWTTAYLAGQGALPAAQRVPVLRCEPPAETGGGARTVGAATRAALAEWFARFRPEAVIGASLRVLDELRALGVAVPRDARFVALAAAGEGAEAGESGGVAAVRANSETVGEVAVSLLDTQVQQHAFGVPRVATSTLIEGSWCDGPTAAARGGDFVWSERVAVAV